MAFNIEKFKSETNGGFVKPSNFLVYILPPIWALNTEYDYNLAYLTSATSLPGMQILTQEARIYGAGPLVKMPYDIATTDITMTFYVDADGISINYFYEWLRNVVNLSHDQQEVRSGAFSNQVAYRSWYSTKIDIMLFNDKPGGDPSSPQDAALAIYTLFDAYPVNISEPSLSWQAGNEILQFNVTFSYRSFERTVVNLPGKRSINIPQVPVPPDVGAAPARPVPVPPTLSYQPPQTTSGQSGKAFTNPRLQAVNDFARSLRDGAMKVRTESVSKVNDVRKATMSNEFVQAGINILNTANEIKGTLGSLKQLNTSLKKGLIQDLKGAVKGKIPGL